MNKGTVTAVDPIIQSITVDRSGGFRAVNTLLW